MITENYNDYKDGGTHKEFTLSVVGEQTEIGNTNLMSESIKLEEALCSENNLRFGCCEASQFTAQIANEFTSLEGKYVDVSVEMDNAVTKYGTFKIVSDKPTADRIWRVIKGYDKMYDILNADVLEWYNGLTFPMTLKAFRDSFFTYLGITQETVTLINDSFQVQQGFSATGSLSGKTIITAICEFNGVFGHINRDGNFEYVSLDSASSFNCPPYENNSVTYEDYVTETITKVTMRGTTSDVGTSVGVDGNEYIITNNPLIYGTEGTQALTTALTNLLNKISQITFRPFSLGKTIGNPCVELGDAIVISTKYQTINSYVIKRVLSGIQALRDNYSATGNKIYPKEVNTIQSQINRLQGKTNELEITVDGTVSTVTRLETTVDGYSDDIQTANNNASTALSTANNANMTAITAQSQVTQLADQIVLKVDENGNIVKVELSANPSTGTNFKVTADNISFIANGIIDLTANLLSVQTSKFTLAQDGTININANSMLTINGNGSGPGTSGIEITYSSGLLEYHSTLTPGYLEVYRGVSSNQNQYTGKINGSTLTLSYKDTTLISGINYYEATLSHNSLSLINKDVNNNQTTLFSVDSTGKIKSNSLTASKILVADANKNIVSSSYEFDISTNNTSDTWLLVMNGTKIQHRLSTNLSVNYATSAGSATGANYINAWRGSNVAIGTITGWSNSLNVVWYSQTGVLSNQPSQYGYLLDIGMSAERHQIFMTQANGSLYHRGGNGSTTWTNQAFKEILDSSNYTNYCIKSYAQSGTFNKVNYILEFTSSNNYLGNTSKGNYIWGVSSWSDIRLKTNIKDSRVNALNLINKIQIREFDFKDEKFGTHKDIGYVAQELMEVIPECVEEVELPDEDKEKYGVESMYQVEDKHMIPYLVKAIQEQQRQIQELKQSNSFYQNIILQMQAEIEQIKQKTEE